ncbi:serine hydrolase domain-containing protein [Candidatus Neomarinimicrobiota bacterium]
MNTIRNILLGYLFVSLNIFCQTDNEIIFSDLDDINQYLTKQTIENKFSGTVLIAKDGIPIFKKAYGFASKRYDIPNTFDTKFNIGSISKHITSIAILQLAERGLLSLDDPIGKYLDIFPIEIAQKVNIKHLLTMTSGWGDYWGNKVYIANRYEYRTITEYLNFIKDIPLDFEPGTDIQHCNIGFEVAGAIIEIITNKSYYDYIRENIYIPIGMSNSDSYDVDGPVKNLATGYTNEHYMDTIKVGFNWENSYLRLPTRGTPTGGSYSTVEDLFKLTQAHRNNKLLSKDYSNYLLNFFQGSFGEEPTILKSGIIFMFGGAEGVGAVIGLDMMDDDTNIGYTIIILSNYDFEITQNLYSKIKDFVKKLKQLD